MFQNTFSTGEDSLFSFCFAQLSVLVPVLGVLVTAHFYPGCFEFTARSSSLALFSQ